MTALAPDASLKLILGSGSPRRLELLGQLGLTPHAVRPPDIDEDVRKGENPRDYVNRVALEKAQAVSAAPDEVVLCADTTVAAGRRILGKPADVDEARKFLQTLSGRRHEVITALAVRREDCWWQRDVVSQVKLKRLSEAEIDWYLASDDWQGKAGGYAIQGPASAFIPWISGSFHAIMGLPLPETAALLTAAGLPIMRASQ